MTIVTGFTPKVRRIIIDRADRYCERCGECLGEEIHHRRPRGSGGTKRESTNLPSNGLYLCRDCHSFCELKRDEARKCGWLLRQTQDPATVPVFYRGTWVVLDDLGNLHDYPTGSDAA